VVYPSKRGTVLVTGRPLSRVSARA